MPDVHVCEVGPRDGLQNAHHLMPTEAKKAWIRALAAAGLKEIEVGSFVPPKLIPAMVSMVASGIYSCVLASRILGGGALEGGMPWWRYVSNRFLTLFGNILLGTKVSEFHTGYRAFSRQLLEALPLSANSDDFVFDNQILAETVWLGFQIGEVSCPTSYAPDASSIKATPPPSMHAPRSG